MIVQKQQFELKIETGLDLRNTIHPKNESTNNFKPYYQVFEQKYGFSKNLSITTYNKLKQRQYKGNKNKANPDVI